MLIIRSIISVYTSITILFINFVIVIAALKPLSSSSACLQNDNAACICICCYCFCSFIKSCRGAMDCGSEHDLIEESINQHLRAHLLVVIIALFLLVVV